MQETSALIRDAGFEVDGNDLFRELASRTASGQGTAPSQFRVPDGSDELLKPEIARA